MTIKIVHLLEEIHIAQNPSDIDSKTEKHEKVNTGLDIEMENSERNIANNSLVNQVLMSSSYKNSNQDEFNNNISQLPTESSSQNLIDANSEHQSITTVDLTPIKIVDVFQNVDFFQLFYEKFHVFAEGGLSLAVNAIESDERKIYNCVLMDNVYLHGVSLCLGERIVFYLNLQENGTNGLSFAEKISFLRQFLMRSDFTLKILDAREQMKKIFSLVSLFHVNLLFEDPKIAEWLPQSNIEPDLNQMVSMVVAAYIYIIYFKVPPERK